MSIELAATKKRRRNTRDDDAGELVSSESIHYSSPSPAARNGNKKKSKNRRSSFLSVSSSIPSSSSLNNKTSAALLSLQEERDRLSKIRKELPVYAFKQEIIRKVRENDVLLVMAETGSGKSTQIPAYLEEGGLLASIDNGNTGDNKNRSKYKNKGIIFL